MAHRKRSEEEHGRHGDKPGRPQRSSPGDEQLKRRRHRRQQAHAADLGVVVGFQTLAGKPETATRVR